MSLKQIAFWQTLIADTPDCMKARCYRKLAEDIDRNEHFSVPTPMISEELEDIVEQYGD